jgi:hypothetical protein
MRGALLLTLAVALASPAPTPIPEAVLPVDYPQWCRDHRSGAFTGLVSTARGVFVVCSRTAWLFTRVGVPAVEVTPLPGVTEKPR